MNSFVISFFIHISIFILLILEVFAFNNKILPPKGEMVINIDLTSDNTHSLNKPIIKNDLKINDEKVNEEVIKEKPILKENKDGNKDIKLKVNKEIPIKKEPKKEPKKNTNNKKFEEDRIAKKLKSLKKNLSNNNSKNTNETSKANVKAGSPLSWSERNIIIDSLRPCWERYQAGAKQKVTVIVNFDSEGYPKGDVKYISGDRSYSYIAAKRAIGGCKIEGIMPDKMKNITDGFEITFTPFGVDF